MSHAAAAVPLLWHTARGVVRLDRPAVVGILNVTPDSFWDGGRHAGVAAAVHHVGQLVVDGADIIDIGGESTRPGAVPVDERAEIERVVPVVEAVCREWPEVPISVDTTKGAVARAALDAGAAIINDVSGLRFDPSVGREVARANAGIILMHSRGPMDRMARYDLADYGDDPVADVVRELNEAVDRARDSGIADDAIVIDPGFGFAKQTHHSLAILARLDQLVQLGYPVLAGPSRKRFIGDAGGGALPIDDRLEGTIAACVMALMLGARLFRVHDVAAVRRALDFADAARRSAVHS